MFRISFLILFLSFSILTTSGQTTEVSQEFVDRANQAFKELAALREAIKAKNEALDAKNEALKAKDEAIRAKDALIKQKQERIDYLVSIKCQESSTSFKPLGWSIIKFKKKRCFE